MLNGTGTVYLLNESDLTRNSSTLDCTQNPNPYSISGLAGSAKEIQACTVPVIIMRYATFCLLGFYFYKVSLFQNRVLQEF